MAKCPLFDRCRDPKAKPTGPRNFFFSDYAYQQRHALLYLKTEAFQQDMRLRPLVERIIANLVRYHGARRARRRGQPKVDFQAKMNTMAFNLRQWMRQLAQRSSVAATP